MHAAEKLALRLAVALLVASCGGPAQTQSPVGTGSGDGGGRDGTGGSVATASGGSGGGSGGSGGSTGTTAGGDGGNMMGGAGGVGDDGGPPDVDGGLAPDTARPVDSGTSTDLPVVPSPTNSVFKHPGVLVNRAQLDFMRAKVAAGEEPWRSMFEKTKARAAATTKPSPIAQVICGPYSNPNIGCAEEYNDFEAAWANALAWYVTADEAYAKKAIEIMNAWARTIKGHSDHNAPLQAGWAAEVWPRAGELIRWTYPGWAPADVAKFEGMLKNVYLPAIINGNVGANGNWELTMAEGTINIAVFLDDKASFDRGVALWRRRVPKYLYLKSEGAQADGLAQETCRDFLHTQLGMSAAINAAETAYQQGVDLYGEGSARLRAGLEFHADYLLGKPAPSSLCGGKLNLRTLPMWEIAFNHYDGRLGLPLPLTQKLIETQIRPKTDPVYKQMAWETLTHAQTGKLGL